MVLNQSLKLVRTSLNVLLSRDFYNYLSLYAPITLNECDAWFHLNAACQSRCEERETSEHYKFSIVGFNLYTAMKPAYKPIGLTARPIQDCYEWRNKMPI